MLTSIIIFIVAVIILLALVNTINREIYDGTLFLSNSIKDVFLSVNEFEKMNNELREEILQSIETFLLLEEICKEDPQNNNLTNKLIREKKNILDKINNFHKTANDRVMIRKIIATKKYMKDMLDKKINSVKKKRMKFIYYNPPLDDDYQYEIKKSSENSNKLFIGDLFE